MSGQAVAPRLELVNCTLTDNEASSGPGGAVTAFLLSLLVRGCELTRNIARQVGASELEHTLRCPKQLHIPDTYCTVLYIPDTATRK